MQAISKIGDSFGAGILRSGGLDSQARIRGRWRAECYGPDGRLKWVEDFDNIVVNEGLTLIEGTKYFVEMTAVVTGFEDGFRRFEVRARYHGRQ